ncbi:MAG: acyl-CoA thioester hydrolase/BAAT C-terminal domain-containing protein [Solirubrobacteraceae bacterium]
MIDFSGRDRAARGGDRDGLQFRAVDAGGAVGTLVLPPLDQRRGAAVVVLGGSRGGLDDHDAIAFAKAGFMALALAYFGVGELPPALVEVPLEYVRRAIEWLRRQPELADRRVGVVGRSKGGELALLLAATSPPDISAVVGYTPSPIIWQGLPADRRGWRKGPRSSWSVDGNPVPFLPFAQPRARDMPGFVVSVLAQKVALQPVYERALVDPEARERATTPLEQIAGPVLLISGTGDQLGPAPTLCELAMSRLAGHQHPFPDQHLSYDGAGHLIGPPGCPATKPGRFAEAGARLWTPRPVRTPGRESSNSSNATFRPGRVASLPQRGPTKRSSSETMIESRDPHLTLRGDRHPGAGRRLLARTAQPVPRHDPRVPSR